MPDQKSVFIISDSTGETAYHVLQTVLAQFDSEHIRIRRYSDVTTPQQIAKKFLAGVIDAGRRRRQAAGDSRPYYGLATLCGGGGVSMACALELV